MLNTIPSSAVQDFKYSTCSAQQTHTLLYVNMYLKVNTVQSHNSYIFNWVARISKAWVWELSNLQSKIVAYLILALTIYLFVPICFLCMINVKTFACSFHYIKTLKKGIFHYFVIYSPSCHFQSVCCYFIPIKHKRRYFEESLRSSF